MSGGSAHGAGGGCPFGGADGDRGSWTAEGFFEILRQLGPLRVITISGPSVFEAICELEAFGVSGGYLNAMTPRYHWHLELEGFGHLRTRDEVHRRSGRRVLFFELSESAAAEPFLRIYLHREKGADFEPERQAIFAELHQLFGEGRDLQGPRGAKEPAGSEGVAS